MRARDLAARPQAYHACGAIRVTDASGGANGGDGTATPSPQAPSVASEAPTAQPKPGPAFFVLVVDVKGDRYQASSESADVGLGGQKVWFGQHDLRPVLTPPQMLLLWSVLPKTHWPAELSHMRIMSKPMLNPAGTAPNRAGCDCSGLAASPVHHPDCATGSAC